MKQMRKMLKTTLLTTLFLLLAVSLLSRFPAIGNSLSEKAANWWTDKNAQLDRSIYGNECISETKHSLPFLMLASASAEEETPEYLTIRLNWAGDEDKTELRPSYNVRLYVTKNGGSSSAYYVSGSNNWEVTTTASLKGADGSDYQYALDYVGTYLWPTYVVTDGVPFGEAAVLKLDETGKVSTYPETWKYLQQRAADGHYIFVLDENGQRALYDVNGDGIVSEETNTLYGYTDFTPSMIQTIQNGLAKTVKGESGIYQKDDIVVLEGHYSYKLRLTTQKNGETSNVVLYDILENAANTGGASGEPNGWKGTFVGVNTRVAQALGVAPVVLYSTEKLSYNNPDALLIENNPDVWSTTPPEDFSTVTAVAFDLRKAADGSNFIFPENSNVEVEITLQAPDGIQPSEYAYNRPAYNSTFKAAYAQEGSTSALPLR